MELLLKELNNLPEDLSSEKTSDPLGINGKIYQEGSLEYIYLEGVRGEDISNYFKSGKYLQIISNTDSK
jgi:hypothetical protein